MTKELKVRIDDLGAFLQRLERLGAEQGPALEIETVYFEQPEGLVLKLSQDTTGAQVVRLKQAGDGFDLLSTEPAQDFADTRKRLAAEYGEKSALTKTETHYTVPDKNYDVLVTEIDSVGNFAVVLGDGPKTEMLADDFGLFDPEIIKVPFDEVGPR